MGNEFKSWISYRWINCSCPKKTWFMNLVSWKGIGWSLCKKVEICGHEEFWQPFNSKRIVLRLWRFPLHSGDQDKGRERTFHKGWLHVPHEIRRARKRSGREVLWIADIEWGKQVLLVHLYEGKGIGREWYDKIRIVKTGDFLTGFTNKSRQWF